MDLLTDMHQFQTLQLSDRRQTPHRLSKALTASQIKIYTQISQGCELAQLRDMDPRLHGQAVNRTQTEAAADKVGKFRCTPCGKSAMLSCK